MRAPTDAGAKPDPDRANSVAERQPSVALGNGCGLRLTSEKAHDGRRANALGFARGSPSRRNAHGKKIRPGAPWSPLSV